MKEGHYKEVQKIYHTQMSNIINGGGKVSDPAYQEVMEAEQRAMYEQLPAMCLAEHGRHTERTEVYVFCLRCGTFLPGLEQK